MNQAFEEKNQGIIENIIPSHWQEATILANGISQRYYRSGGEKPALILLHGFSESGLSWSRVAKALEADYDLILPDARGHGLSGGPETGYSQELLVQDVVGLIHALHVQQAALLGHSNGALTAAHLAADHPELVRALVLEDPPWGETAMQPPPTNDGGEPWPGFSAWYRAWLDWHAALRTQTLEERLSSSHQFLPPGALNWPREELITFLESQARFNLGVLNHVPFFPARSPWRETVERMVCPVLLLTGDAGRGAMIAPEQAREIVAACRAGQLVAFSEVGHMMHHEMQGAIFERSIETIKAFLSEA